MHSVRKNSKKKKHFLQEQRRRTSCIIFYFDQFINFTKGQDMNNKNESNLGAWIDMAEGLYDFLNRRKTTINYDFKQLSVSVPQGIGPGSEKAEWMVSGMISVSTTENDENQTE